jgi:hypothetical protein
MKQQIARLAILAHALTGVTATISRPGAEQPMDVLAGSDNEIHLLPGDEVTIKVASDDRWVEKQKKADEAAQAKATQRDDVDHTTDLDKAARKGIAANPQAGPDLSGDAGMTLDEGKAQAAAADPADPGTAPGAVTSTTGATTRRSTRGSTQG